jgi:transposase
VPTLVDRYARRTRRLRSDFEAIGLMLGGRPGSRLSARQKKPTSRMTLLRLVRALPEPPVETPSVLGVDEFAFRRGRRYGTILIDGSGHQVIDLLEDPSADALVNWLTEHPGNGSDLSRSRWRVRQCGEARCSNCYASRR